MPMLGLLCSGRLRRNDLHRLFALRLPGVCRPDALQAEVKGLFMSFPSHGLPCTAKSGSDPSTDRVI